MTGGSGRWFWEIYRRLPRERVVIAAGQQPGQEQFDAGHDVRVERVALTFADWGLRSRAGRTGYWRAWSAVRQLLKNHDIGEIHCGKALPEGWLAWLAKLRYRTAYLCYVHGEELMVAERSRELRWLTHRVLGGARLVIANSLNSKELLADRWNVDEKKMCVLNPGADMDEFKPASRDEAARQALGWSGRSVVLTVGRLQRRKGQDMFIRALPAIRQRVPDVLYSIVGDGDDRECLRRLAVETGVADCVQFRGEPADAELVRCYQQCDLFVLPNRTVDGDIEGFGMVLVEAQACGKPVIAGASGGTRETMIVGETGVIVDCTSPTPLSDAVNELLSDRRRLESMGRAGREWAAREFDWQRLSSKAILVFQQQPSRELRGAHACSAVHKSHESEHRAGLLAMPRTPTVHE
jgi:phosphatidyl-myo-inositol dimannoside synthase